MKSISKKKYPWLISLWATIGIMILALASFVAYAHTSNDLAPDSLGGLTYAIAGLIFMGLATVAYTLLRRSRKRRVGSLNAALHWHISFGILALFFIVLHSFGNFALVSGTYALLCLIALIISGMLGRMFDRLVPRLIAREVNIALTEQGDDRIEAVLRDVTSYAQESIHSLPPQQDDRAIGERNQRTLATAATHLVSHDGRALPTSWDLAYISLDETVQEMEYDREAARFVANHKSSFTERSALDPSLQERMAELQTVQQAFQRERLYRSIIHYWRIIHILLVLLTIGLTLWHLEFAATIMISSYLHH